MAELPSGWSLESGGNALVCELRFDGFAAAFAFMTEMAIYSEKVDHHPEWSNVYDRVSIRLTTHETGGLTERDFRWARQASVIVARVTGASAAR
jgi:4a-hydroxytetrahydrobiopterin dehydratase